MEIAVTSGTGQGLTKLAAFDRALYAAGIANYNLIKLSSVIPIGTKVVVRKAARNDQEIGHKLYVVLSESYAGGKGETAWAGMGWFQDKESAGVFMEASGSTREGVEMSITASLDSLRKYRSENYGDLEIKTESIECHGHPVCALVCAVYKSEGWD